LEGADIQFRRENRLDIALVKNLPIALVFLPAADIPTFVVGGRVSLGITGRDMCAEHMAGLVDEEALREGHHDPSNAIEAGAVEVMDLDFGSCKLQLQVPEKGPHTTPVDLVGKNIGTSFVHLTRKYFNDLERELERKSEKKSPRTKIIELTGSVEAACALSAADAVTDLVDTGESMKAAGLEAIDTLMTSSAVLIKSRNPSNPELVDLIASRIKGVISKS
jgi:ATP phosphoribosyltransferase